MVSAGGQLEKMRQYCMYIVAYKSGVQNRAKDTLLFKGYDTIFDQLAPGYWRA